MKEVVAYLLIVCEALGELIDGFELKPDQFVSGNFFLLQNLSEIDREVSEGKAVASHLDARLLP